MLGAAVAETAVKARSGGSAFVQDAGAEVAGPAEGRAAGPAGAARAGPPLRAVRGAGPKAFSGRLAGSAASLQKRCLKQVAPGRPRWQSSMNAHPVGVRIVGRRVPYSLCVEEIEFRQVARGDEFRLRVKTDPQAK